MEKELKILLESHHCTDIDELIEEIKELFVPELQEKNVMQKIIEEYLAQATEYEKSLIMKKKTGTVEGFEYISTPFENYLLNKLCEK